MVAEPKPIGHRLNALRCIFGITQGELAAKLKSSQPFVSQIARGVRPMPEAMLVDACREFGLPRAFFTVQQGPADLGAATFRKTANASAREEHRVVALYDEASRLFREISHASGYRSADLPDPDDYDGDPERVASALRSAGKLGKDEPVPNVIRTLERLGVGVVDNLDNLDDETRGHTAISRPTAYNDRPLVALVADVPGAVKRLTLLHEVGHLIFDKDLAASITSTRSPEEKRAYKFAGAFLMPRSVVEARVSETLNLHGYLPIKAEYGMSVGAIIMRARELGVISHDRARSLQIQLSSQGWRTNEPVPVADETPQLLGQALRKVYGAQALARAAHVTGVRPEWINQWIHGNAPSLAADTRGEGRVIDLDAARARRG